MWRSYRFSVRAVRRIHKKAVRLLREERDRETYYKSNPRSSRFPHGSVKGPCYKHNPRTIRV